MDYRFPTYHSLGLWLKEQLHRFLRFYHLVTSRLAVAPVRGPCCTLELFQIVLELFR
jgi:hypothetical protein